MILSQRRRAEPDLAAARRALRVYTLARLHMIPALPTHIFKPLTGGVDGHAGNEHICMSLARAVGLAVDIPCAGSPLCGQSIPILEAVPMKRVLAAILAFGITVAGPVAFAQQTGSSQSGTTMQQPTTGGSTTPAAGKQAPKAKKDLTPQQKKMSDCSHEAKAKGFKGDQRKQFMSTCLKSD